MKCLFCKYNTRPYYPDSDSEVCEWCDTRYLLNQNRSVLISYYFSIKYKDAIYTASFYAQDNLPKDTVVFLLYSSKGDPKECLLRMTTLPNITPFNLANKLKKLLVFS